MRRCKAERDFATPLRYSKVNGYTMSNRTTKTLPSMMSCFMVTFTDSFNSNMGFLRDEAAVDAPTTAVRRALVGGYEVFTLLATIQQGGEPCWEPRSAPWPRICLWMVSPLTTSRVWFQFFTHNG